MIYESDDGLGPYCLVPVTRGAFAKVSPEDFERAAALRWQLCAGPGRRTRYARHGYFAQGRQRAVPLQVFLLAPPAGFQVDHRNGDGLDNRRPNLRLATVSQNQINKALCAKNTSGYKGVSVTRSGKFRAQIGVRGRKVYLGRFLTPEEAARAYDAAARDLFGEFARLNFPTDEGAGSALHASPAHTTTAP